MWLDFYMFLTLVSGVALTAFGWQLCGIHIPHKENTRKLRRARAVLTVSYFILAVPAFAELFNGGEADRKIIAVFTVAAAAYQSLLFTITLLIFINPPYITRRRVMTQLGVVTTAVVIFLSAALISDLHWIFLIALVAYIMQLVYYTLLFHRIYTESLRMMEEYYDEEQYVRMRWAKFGFYAALTVGIIASLSVWLPSAVYNFFTIGYVLFYGWFANRFSNYVVKLNYYLPAVTRQPEQSSSQVTDVAVAGWAAPEITAAKEHLRLALGRWVADRGYTRSEDSKDQIIMELGTTKDLFNWYFKTVIQQDFRSWRIGLRIEYAKQLMNEGLGISMNDLAKEVGYTTKSNFYGHFKKITGETPVEYLRRITSKR